MGWIVLLVFILATFGLGLYFKRYTNSKITAYLGALLAVLSTLLIVGLASQYVRDGKEERHLAREARAAGFTDVGEYRRARAQGIKTKQEFDERREASIIEAEDQLIPHFFALEKEARALLAEGEGLDRLSVPDCMPRMQSLQPRAKQLRAQIEQLPPMPQKFSLNMAGIGLGLCVSCNARLRAQHCDMARDALGELW